MNARTCDTSVLVPALVSWHPAHQTCRQALVDVGTVPAHVLIEGYSTLTRLPAPHRVAPRDAAALIAGLPFEPVAMDPSHTAKMIARLGAGGVRGGATYDALIAATALQHDLDLITRDARARSTYESVGVRHHLLD